MKTPEEIKMGLKACGDDCCSACTYWDECNPEEYVMALAKDALAYIQQLEEHILGLPKMVPKWISVDERLPKSGRYVLCWYESGAGSKWATVGRIKGNSGTWELDVDPDDELVRTVTHWMTLPEPPKEV